MPVYEFRCRKCGGEFEERRLFSEADKSAKCPACGGAGEKLISGFGFKLGFYTRPSEKPLRAKEGTRPGETGASRGKAPAKSKGGGRTTKGARKPASGGKRRG